MENIAETQTMENVHPELHELIRDLYSEGLEVYADPKPTLSKNIQYFYITDGTNVGYCQLDRLSGIGFYTVHKPSTQNGTGGKVSDGFNYHKGIVNEAKKSLAYVPSWWNFGSVTKYKNFQEFNTKRHNNRLVKIVI